MSRTGCFSIVFFLAVILFSFGQTPLAANDEVRVVRLLRNVGTGGLASQMAYLIEPEILTITKGTIVVWANSGVFEIEVAFEEGKTCQLATKAAEGFELDKAKACYTTVVMPNGGTRSLRFLEKGVYEYTVRWGDLIQKSRGKIVVY